VPAELIAWFESAARSLPWREERTPYRVFVSEVMLQQTRAEVVALYYHRFLARFPTLKALAEASVEEVIKVWEGLGYYGRARRLHAAARLLLDQYGGELPISFEELVELPGVSHYTASAILAFGMQRPAVAVDGNVMRLFSRLFAIEESIDEKAVIDRARRELKQLMPKEKGSTWAEALIELGATICTPKPRCQLCPLRARCRAFELGMQQNLPVRRVKEPPRLLWRQVAVVQAEGAVLLYKEEGKGVMQGLYQFLYFETEEGKNCREELKRRIEALTHVPVELLQLLPTQKHSFTRFRATLYPTLCSLPRQIEVASPYLWVDEEMLSTLPFSAGHRRILKAGWV